MIAQEGLTDLLPAVRQAFNDDPTDDRLDQVFGSSPRATILALAVVGIVVGELFGWFGPDFELKEYIHWPAVVVGVLYAVMIRRYLFGSQQAKAEDFPWLAASLVPAVVLLVIVTATSTLVSGLYEGSSAPALLWTVTGSILVAITDALGVAAALTIAVAALCFDRNWMRALWDLAIRLFCFRLMVYVTALVMLEIGIVGSILSEIFEGILGLKIPEWLPELADQIGYAALLTVVYLAVIGGTWTVCRNGFAELLQTGHVRILDTLVNMTKNPKKKKKRVG